MDIQKKAGLQLNHDQKQIDNYVYNYKTGRLGKGAFGVVYVGQNIITQQEIAIKIIRKRDLEDKDDEMQLFQEIQIMEQIQSENVVKLYDVLQTDNNYYIIMEYCQLGDLDIALFKNNLINSSHHYKFLIDILTGFIELIRKGIIHRDLKPANILIKQDQNQNFIFKLGDFGFACKLNSFRKEMLNSKVGTPLYMSPQLLENNTYTSKSDIWSLAIMLYQFIYHKTPWTGRSEEELLSRIKNKPIYFPEQPIISQLAKDFITGCLQVSESDRFCWDQLYRHPYVSGHFQNYIKQGQQLENKVIYLLGNLRTKVGTSNLYQLFSDLDISGDRALNLQEFSELMWKIDKDLDRHEISMVFDEIDVDGNGDIDFLEFKRSLQLNSGLPKFKRVNEARLNDRVYQVLTRVLNAINKYKLNLYNLFKKYDTSGNGSLDRQEIKQLFYKIDSTLTEQDFDMTINLFDANGDGEIQFIEFKKIFEDLERERMKIKQSPKTYHYSITQNSSNTLQSIKQYFKNQRIIPKPQYDADDENISFDEESVKMQSSQSKQLVIKSEDGISIIPMVIPKRK